MERYDPLPARTSPVCGTQERGVFAESRRFGRHYTGSVRLRLEIELARIAGRLSRLAARGGGTTIPGKILATIDPGALGRLAARLPLGCALVTGTNGKTTTTAMLAEILGRRVRLAHNRAGANLVSGVASTLLEARNADLGLFEVDEGAFPEVARRARPRAVCLANLFRDQLDRYGELELVAERWRMAVSELDPAATVVANADDPLIANLVRGREPGLRFGLDDPAVARERLPHAADSKYCVDCGAPYVYETAYVGHLGSYRCPGCGNARPPLDIAARSVDLDGLEGSTFDLATGSGSRRVTLPLPGLYNVYNALAAASLALALGATLDEIATGLARFRAAFGRFERIRVGDRTVLVLLVKNPAGANEAVRTLVDAGAPALAVVALNDEIADGRDVSWIWDVDFEPLAATLERLVVTGERAHELALRFKYGGVEPDRIEVLPALDRALDRGLELTPAGGELPVLPTYTAMLALRRIAADRGLVRPYWETDGARQAVARESALEEKLR
jgi:lipid II isoglutaminyl synthase (glutamine-hydrolysing)